MSQRSHVEICDRCKGSGSRYWEELVNHHKGEYDTHKEECSKCKGSGRVLITVTTKTEPYNGQFIGY
jgi:DnaJ-class molecular chaperone